MVLESDLEPPSIEEMPLVLRSTLPPITFVQAGKVELSLLAH
jgi:hypothetical protein